MSTPLHQEGTYMFNYHHKSVCLISLTCHYLRFCDLTPHIISGIFHHEPKDAPGAKFRCTVCMGVFEGNAGRISDAVCLLRDDFGPDDYNFLSRNCNHFADAFCKALIDQRAPAWVNRMANIGSYFSCLFPPQMLGDAPVNEGGNFLL